MRERQLGVVVEVVLATEEDDLVLDQRVVDLRRDRGIHTVGDPDTVDARTDDGPEFDNTQR